MRDKLKSKSFWLSFVAALVLVSQILGFKIDVPIVNEAVSAVCALLIFLGVMKDDAKQEVPALVAGNEISTEIKDNAIAETTDDATAETDEATAETDEATAETDEATAETDEATAETDGATVETGSQIEGQTDSDKEDKG